MTIEAFAPAADGWRVILDGKSHALAGWLTVQNADTTRSVVPALPLNGELVPATAENFPSTSIEVTGPFYGRI